MSVHLDIRPYKALGDLMLWAHWGTTDRLTVCFSGIGAKPDEVQPYEFADTATNGGTDSALFVADTRRSWLNTPGLIERIVAEVEGFAAAIGARVVQTLGHSMGGYMAMILPGFTRVEAAVGFSPQASVHPEVAGDDPRWVRYRDKIEHHRIRNVNDHMNDTTRYYAFHGMHRREAPQRERFVPRANLTHILIPKTVHEVPQKLRTAGIMSKVVWTCFHDRNHRLRTTLDPIGARYRTANNATCLPPSSEILAHAAQNRDVSSGDHHDQV